MPAATAAQRPRLASGAVIGETKAAFSWGCVWDVSLGMHLGRFCGAWACATLLRTPTGRRKEDHMAGTFEIFRDNKGEYRFR